MASNRDSEAPLIFLIAGEPSGDLLGARLMEALRQETGGRVRFAGLGGEHMARAGLQSLFPIEELSLMGVFEVLPRAAKLLRRMRQTAAAIREARPVAVVSIDVPGFCFGVWRRLHGSGIPLIHYVAPTVWAWRPWRVKKFARHLDHMMTLLPFEPPYFERAGLAASFVGHPVVERAAIADPAKARSAFRAHHGIAEDALLVCLLPGSRRGEVRRLLPHFGDALTRMAAARPGVRAVVPSVPAVEGEVRQAIADWPAQPVLVTDTDARMAAMAASDVALAASGTVSLELTLAGTPHVIAYRIHPLTYALVKRMVRVDYVTLSNILLDAPVVPELLQADCTGEKLAGALDRLLDDRAARAAQIEAGREVASMLGAGDAPPSTRAARLVLELIAGQGAMPALAGAGVRAENA